MHYFIQELLFISPCVTSGTLLIFLKIMYIGRFHDLGILFQERKGGTGSDTLL